MEQTYKLATLIINGMSNDDKIRMLNDFLHKNDIDWLLLQEATTDKINNIPNYVCHSNIGTNGRDTAILEKNATR
jgi:hypothetical protein